MIDTRWMEMPFQSPLPLLLMSLRQRGSLPPTLSFPGKEKKEKKLILVLFVCVSVSFFFYYLAASQNS